MNNSSQIENSKENEEFIGVAQNSCPRKEEVKKSNKKKSKTSHKSNSSKEISTLKSKIDRLKSENHKLEDELEKERKLNHHL